ncbi:MAG: hypothetical protein HFG65_03470 [Hungatella sp.]|nr:hypothetical protein [Hungatella sp.]
MLTATKKVNTHKGAIFTMGILCAALGRLPREQWSHTDTVLDQCAALLALITAATDTNIIARSSLPVQQEIVAQIKKLLQDNPYPDTQTLSRLNKEFTEKNISPGGCADLLAVCYLLYFLENENTEPSI